MELRHLRHFIGVAEELHFGRAALRLHIEQSPLSRSIKELESDLGVKLFERTTRSTRLTRSGELFLKESVKILAAIEQARARLKPEPASVQNLRIAITDNLANARLSQLLSQSINDEPDLKFYLIEMTATQLISALKNNEVDLGITLSNNPTNEYISEAMWEDTMELIVPMHHPLTAFRTVTIKEVLDYPLVVHHPEKCSGTHKYIQSILGSENKQESTDQIVSNLETMLMAVSAGCGVGFVSSSQISLLNKYNVVTKPISNSLPPLTTYFWRLNTPASQSLIRLLERSRRFGGRSRQSERGTRSRTNKPNKGSDLN